MVKFWRNKCLLLPSRCVYFNSLVSTTWYLLLFFFYSETDSRCYRLSRKRFTGDSLTSKCQTLIDLLLESPCTICHMVRLLRRFIVSSLLRVGFHIQFRKQEITIRCFTLRCILSPSKMERFLTVCRRNRDHYIHWTSSYRDNNKYILTSTDFGLKVKQHDTSYERKYCGAHVLYSFFISSGLVTEFDANCI